MRKIAAEHPVEKIGEEEVKKELAEIGLTEEQIKKSINFIKIERSFILR